MRDGQSASSLSPQHSRSRRDDMRLSNKRSPYLFGVATANRTKVTTPNKYGAEIIARTQYARLGELSSPIICHAPTATTSAEYCMIHSGPSPGSKPYSMIYPEDTRRDNNVVMTSKRRRDVVLTSQWRYYCVVCPLGTHIDFFVTSKTWLSSAWWPSLRKLDAQTKSFPMKNIWVNSLRPSDAIWRHRSGSTLAQLLACCLTAPSHYLNQCWLIISKVLWHSSAGDFIRDTSATIHYKFSLKFSFLKFKFKSPRGQWVKMIKHHHAGMASFSLLAFRVTVKPLV